MTNELKIVDWSTGTDEEIQAMLEAHYNGELNISDYWKVGDTRIVIIPGVPKSMICDSQPPQTLELVIIGINHDTLETPINGITKAAITVQTKNCLSTSGSMNLHYDEPVYTLWSESKMRDWLNTTFRVMLPTYLSDLIKPVVKTSNRWYDSNYSSYISYRTHSTTIDSVFLLSEYEMFGTTYFTASYWGTMEPDGTQYEYMKTQSNRIKTRGGSTTFWFSRTGFVGSSGYSYFRGVYTDGSYVDTGADGSYGVAPGFCL